MTPSTLSLALAVNRFGLGARADEALITTEPRRWLVDQLERYEPAPTAASSLPASQDLVVAYVDYLQELKQANSGNELAVRQDLRRRTLGYYRAQVEARTRACLVTDTPFTERLVHFWANHFAVSVDKAPLGALAGAFEAEAIRPHVTGHFEDMLLAVERHPAMLLYLDQARSVGPNSAFARRAKRAPGLNENLAREILELHTLGVRSGYSQSDVTELAAALTGWTVGGLPRMPRGPAPGSFAFQPVLHEPGPRQVLGRVHDERGEAQAHAVLSRLAVHAATARHVGTKLARHFLNDTPRAAEVDALAHAFERSGGNLPDVYRVLVDLAASPGAVGPKFKTPWEWLVSSMRGLGLKDTGSMNVTATLAELGQPVWRPGSPAGYADTADAWLAPDALMRRVETAQHLAAGAQDLDARTLAARLLPGGVGKETATQIARAESPAAALALLIASPEFLRR